MLRHLRLPLIWTAGSLAVAAFLAPAGAILATLWIVAVLGVLETSLSLDNAVVNAKVLHGMSAVWRRRFLTWGMVVALLRGEA